MAEAELASSESLGLEAEAAAPHDGEALSMEFCARELVAGDYGPVFEREYERSRALCGDGYALPPSSYVARLSGDRLAAYEQRARQRERDQMAIALHASNMRYWTPSLLAR